MRSPNVVGVVLLGLMAAGCAAGGNPDGAPASNDVTTGLAVRADGVAAALEAGQCDAALAEARLLQTDLTTAPLAPPVRAEALAGATRLVNGIVCAPPPPPTTTTVTAAPAPDRRDGGDPGKNRKDRKGDDDDD